MPLDEQYTTVVNYYSKWQDVSTRRSLLTDYKMRSVVRGG